MKSKTLKVTLSALSLSVAFLASEQAFAAGTCIAGNGDWTDALNWIDGGGASCNGSSTIPDAADNATINGYMTVDGNVSITNLTVNAGRRLTLNANLTVTGAATINGDIYYDTGAWPAAITSIGGELLVMNSLAVPNTVTSIGRIYIITAGTLTLGTANVVTGNVIFDTGTLAGILKLAPTGDHTITGDGVSLTTTVPNLDLSGATANKTISSNGSSITFTAVTFPTAASKVITFSAGADPFFPAPMSVPVPAANVATCVNNGVAASASTIATVAAGTSMVCTTPAAQLPSMPPYL